VRASGTFDVVVFEQTELRATPDLATGLPVGVWTMEKTYAGELTGRSATLLTAAFDRPKGIGTYVAMESFEGSIGGRSGAFNFVHSAATTGTDRTDEFFTIVASSGTGELTGIRGVGGMTIDPDGTHNIWFDYELG